MKKQLSILFLGSMILLSGCGVQDLLNEAKIKTDSGKNLDAIELYTRAIAQDKKSVSAYEGRANIYSEAKDYEKAWIDYSEAGEIASEIGDKKKAAELFYLAGTNLGNDLLKKNTSTLEICGLVKKYYRKACDNGNQKACNESCN